MKMVARHWNKSLRNVVYGPSLETFKVKLHEALTKLF